MLSLHNCQYSQSAGLRLAYSSCCPPSLLVDSSSSSSFFFCSTMRGPTLSPVSLLCFLWEPSQLRTCLERRDYLSEYRQKVLPYQQEAAMLENYAHSTQHWTYVSEFHSSVLHSQILHCFLPAYWDCVAALCLTKKTFCDYCTKACWVLWA